MGTEHTECNCTSVSEMCCRICRKTFCRHCLCEHLAHEAFSDRMKHRFSDTFLNQKDGNIALTIKCHYNWLHDIIYRDKKQFWICGRSSDIVSMNTKGEVLHKIPVKGDPKRLAMHPDGALVFADFSTNSVLKITGPNSARTILCNPVFVPRGITCSSAGEILVTLYKNRNSKVARYNDGGKLLQEIKCSAKGTPMYEFPGYIVENRNTDICVSDRHSVVVVDTYGVLRFIYRGNRMTSSVKEFDPRGLCVDSQCNIIVTDFSNNKLHIISSEGAFLKFVLSGYLGHPISVSIDDEDTLWLAEGWTSGHVRVIKYLHT